MFPTPRLRAGRGRLAAATTLAVIAAGALGASPATASLSVVRPNAWDPVTYYGHGGWTADAKGPTSTSTLDADVPAGSTIVRAFLYGTYENYGSTNPTLTDAQRAATFEGTAVTLTQVSSIPFPPPHPDFFYTARADVTSLVAAKVGALGGITSFSASGPAPRPLHGMALVVIYANPSLPEQSIVLMDGNLNPAGDTTTLSFAEPLDKQTPGFTAQLSLGIGWSSENVGGHGCAYSQFSVVRVNDDVLSSCAGGADDASGKPLEYVTVGGVGDSLDVPGGGEGEGDDDDELYDLSGFVNHGDTEMRISSSNESLNDNIFLAIVAIRARATALTEGETLPEPPPVTPAAPDPADGTTTGTGTDWQSYAPELPEEGSLVLLDAEGVETDRLEVAAGVYEVYENAVRFSPKLGFSGTPDPVTFRVEDAYEQHGDASYRPTVLKPEPPAGDSEETTGVATSEHTVTPVLPAGGALTLLDGDGAPVETLTVDGVGRYQVVEGALRFDPDYGFYGDAPAVSFRVSDAYEQSAEWSWTAHVDKPEPPAAENVESTGVGIAQQTSRPKVHELDTLTLVDESGEVSRIEIAEGVYQVRGSSLRFTPRLGYTGEMPAVTYRVKDGYGQWADASYTAFVTAPDPVTPESLTTHGKGTEVQHATIDRPEGAELWLRYGDELTDTVSFPDVGRYDLDRATGEITFTPVLGYVGDWAPVTFVVVDAYDQRTENIYTPVVALPDAPVAGPLTSRGVGTEVQHADLPMLERSEVWLTGPGPRGSRGAMRGVTTVTIPDQGRYDLDQQTGRVTFTPVLGFAGTATPVEYDVRDAYYQDAFATYTPTVTLPAAPAISQPVTTTGTPEVVQQEQVVVPRGGRAMLVDADGRETDSIVIPAVGTYAIEAATGKVTFTAAEGFVGEAPAVKVRVKDAYGQAADTTYRPTVTPVPATPVAEQPAPAPKPAPMCASRRTMVVNWVAPKGTKLGALTLKVGARTVAKLPAAARRATVDLRGLPAGAVKVTVTARTTKGSTLTSTRTYHPCSGTARQATLKTLRLLPGGR